MKKKVIALLLAVTAVTVGLSAFAGCKKDGDDTGNPSGQQHATHNFDKQVSELRYLKSAATTTSKAVYYYSCECGEKGTKTFEYGEKIVATVGLDYALNEDGNGYVVTGRDTVTATDIVIPAEHEGKPVTEIGDEAFKDCSDIKSVSIPDSVTRIGLSAFQNCVGLTSIIIPDSVTSLAGGAFWGCTNLTSVIIPVNVQMLAGGVFLECRGLKEIIFKGTKSQWHNLVKLYWDIGTGDYVVRCTDGTLSKSEAK